MAAKTGRSPRNRRKAQRTGPGSHPPTEDGAGPTERLQKVMAAAGIGSRRHCEELIRAGRVEVDQRVVTELGTKVDLQHHEVRVDGTPLPSSRKLYYLVNKPVGVLCTNSDPAGRPRVIDLLPPTPERLFTVGRLDLSSEGLILVTNDGALANELAHPRYGVEKTYLVLVAGTPEPEVYAKLRKGVHLAEGFARVVSIRVKTALKKSTVLEIVLNEGRNREIRRLLARVGHKVLRLKRVALGGVRLKDLPPGEYRRLGRVELRLLKQARRPVRGRPARESPEAAPAEPAAAGPTSAKQSPAQQPPAKRGERRRGSKPRQSEAKQPAAKHPRPPKGRARDA
jgi:23S rRNA pseudouridine2605 synthase